MIYEKGCMFRHRATQDPRQWLMSFYAQISIISATHGLQNNCSVLPLEGYNMEIIPTTKLPDDMLEKLRNLNYCGNQSSSSQCCLERTYDRRCRAKNKH